jgi:sugar phosphate isomerase/epimerase
MDISLQLYSLREEEGVDFEGALKLAEQAGYQGVEFAGYFGKSADQMKALLAKYHLRAVSTHAGFQRFTEAGAFDEELAYARALGYTLIVCPGIKCDSREQVVSDAKVLEAGARKAAGFGITVGYHNHSHEFVRFDGAYALDVLLENAPSVKLECDVCWAANADVDPVEYLGPLARAGRVCAIHAKELGADKKTELYIGEGAVDFKAIARLCPPGKIPFIVEQEEYHSEHLDGITRSYTALRNVFDSL